MRIAGFAGVLLSMCLLPPTAAGQVRTPGAAASIDVRVVEVPVHVVDGSGNAVRGLTAANFEIADEGKKLPISHFEQIDLAVSPEAPDPRPLHPAARRSFLLLFDMSNSAPPSLLRAREAATSFIDEGLAPRDLGAVALFSVERGFRMLTGFTSDRALLRGAVASLGEPRFFRTSDPLLLAAAPSTSQPGGVERSQSGSEVDAAVLEHVQSLAQEIQRADDAFRRNRVEQQIRNFGHVARLLDAVPGQKQVILLSDGFDASLLHGRESISSAESQADAAASISGEVWKIDNDRRFGSSTSANSLKQMGELFRRSDVVLHAFDIKGLRANVDARQGLRASSHEALFLLSKPTGGQVFKNSNDLAENFDAMLRQQEVVYILGFQPQGTAKPGTFHDLKIRLRGAPAGARVIHRPGYYEPSDEPSGMENALSATAILLNDIPRDEVRISALAAPFATEAGTAVVPVVVEIDGGTLLEGVAGDSLAGEVFVYAFAPDGAVADYLYQRLALDLTKVRDAVLASGLKFYGALALAPGEYEIKTLVRAGGADRDGFRRLSLRVPDFSSATVLPPFVVEEDGQWIMVKGAPRRPAEVDYPFTIAATSFVPRAEAAFSSAESYEIALFTYNIEPEGMQLSAKVTGADGSEHPAKLALVGRSPSSGEKGLAKLLLSFQPEGLVAGNYSLDFTVRDPASAEAVSSSLPFRVK